MHNPISPSFKVLDVAVVGAGLGGLCAALSLRRAGHQVTLYERSDFTGEVGAGVATAPNGTRWLEVWGVDIAAAKPSFLKKLTIHDWESGEVKKVVQMGDSKAKFGYENYVFHRIDIHQALLSACLQDAGVGLPCKLLTNHRACSVSSGSGTIIFQNGVSVTADMIIGADGIHSSLRESIGIVPDAERSDSCCYRWIIQASKLKELGLESLMPQDGTEIWGGFGIEKIVIGSCHGGEVIGAFCFYPTALNSPEKDGWNIGTSPEELIKTYPNLDPRVKTLFAHVSDIKMWRLFVHKAYPYWTKDVVGLLGDAAHPMLPDQAQGFGQAIEDAAALGIIFGEDYFDSDVKKGLKRYEEVRKGRATMVQDAATRARTDITERIGWKTEKQVPGKLTIEEVCGYDMVEHIKEYIANKS